MNNIPGLAQLTPEAGQRRHRHRLYLAIFAAGLSTCVSTFSSAQMLEEVIVTAQKREQSLNDIGMAISAFRGDELETLGVRDTRDLVHIVPGLTMATSNGGTPIYTMRGVGFNTPNMSSTSPVGVYIDEVSYPYPVMSKGLNFDFDRVEILKGPQGTLYGRNTTGGLINYITNKPTDEFEGSLKVEYGEFDSWGLEGFINGGITDNMSGRIAFKTQGSEEGWQKSVSRDAELGEVDRSAVRLSLLWEPSDTLSAQFSASWWEDKSDGQAGQAIHYNPEVGTSPEASIFVVPGLQDAILTNPGSQDADWATADQPNTGPGAGWIPIFNAIYGTSYDSPEPWPGSTATPRPDEFGMDSEMLSLSLRFDWSISDTLTLTSLTGYADFERDDFYDRDGTEFEIVVFNDEGTIESFSQEFRIAGDYDQLKFIAGVFLSSDETEDRSNPWAGQTSILEGLKFQTLTGYADAGVFFPQAEFEEFMGGFRDWQNFANIDTDSRAIFGQVEWAISDAFTLTTGLRYTEDEADFEGCSRDLDDGNILATWNVAFGLAIPQGGCLTNEFAAGEGPFPQPLEVVEKELDEDNWSGRIALDWNLSDHNLLYVSYSRGYKSGAFPSLSGNVASQYDPATQEKLDAYEVGLKSTLAEGRVQLNASMYYYDYKDKQVFGEIEDLIFTTLTRLVNVPESEVRGAELDLTWHATDDVVTRFGVSYMDTEINEYVGFNKFGEPTDFAGAEFEYSPELQAFALISYGFDLTEQLMGRLTIDASYSDDQQADLEGNPVFAVDSYTLVGASLALSPSGSSKWEGILWGRNLTDEYYWNSVQTQTDTSMRYAGMPRTWGVSFRYNF